MINCVVLLQEVYRQISKQRILGLGSSKYQFELYGCGVEIKITPIGKEYVTITSGKSYEIDMNGAGKFISGLSSKYVDLELVYFTKVVNIDRNVILIDCSEAHVIKPCYVYITNNHDKYKMLNNIALRAEFGVPFIVATDIECKGDFNAGTPLGEHVFLKTEECTYVGRTVSSSKYLVDRTIYNKMKVTSNENSGASNGNGISFGVYKRAG